MHGVMLSVFQEKKSLKGMCLVQRLDEICDVDGTVMLTEFKCPVFTLSPNIYVVNPSHIRKPVSIVHVCSLNTCKMINVRFVHDFTNKMFCYNIFCTGNY